MAHARACQDWQTRTRCMGNPGSASPSCSDIAGRVAGEGHGEEPKRDGMNDREQEERHRAPRIQGLDRKQYWLRRWTRLPVRFGRSTGNISCRVNSYFRGPHATFKSLFVFFYESESPDVYKLHRRSTGSSSRDLESERMFYQRVKCV